MVLDVLIGNPPYQEIDGSGLDGGSALYDKFIKAGYIARYTCMIVPMRWLTQYNVKGIDSSWVYSEIHSNKYMDIYYTENSEDIFSGVKIRGGIMYFLKDKEYCGTCEIRNLHTNTVYNRYMAFKSIDMFILDDLAESIVEKTASEGSFDAIVGSCNEFGIESNTITTRHGLKLHRSFDRVDTCGLEEVARGREYINLYKVVIGRTYGFGIKGERVPKPKILGPGDVVTGSLLMIGKSTDKSYCEHVSRYMQTKLFSLLVGLRKSTHNATKEAYKLVPLQDFTSESDINWEMTIKDIEKQLYKKYKFTQEEIDYIESVIK